MRSTPPTSTIVALMAGTVLMLGSAAVPATVNAAADVETPPTSVPVAPIKHDALYVVNGGDGTSGSLSVINTERQSLAATIVLNDAKYPHHIYSSRDGRRLLVAVPGVDFSHGHGGGHDHDAQGAVMVLKARTGATLASRLTPHANHNAVFSADQREVLTSQMKPMQPGSLLVLDPGTLETRREVPAGMGPHEVTVAPDHTGRIWVANLHGGDVSVFDPRSKREITRIPVGEIPVGAWQGRNGFAYVDNEHSQTISAIYRPLLRVLFTIDLGFTPGMAQLGPDGHLWVTDADSGQVVLFSAYRDRRIRAIPTGEGAHAIAFSGDGRSAYITNQDANTVSVIDVRRYRVIKTIPVGNKPNGMVWVGHDHR